MTRRPGNPTNDNQPPERRRTVNEIPEDLPLLEIELALVENCFSAIIGKLLASLANGAEVAAEQETKP